MAGSGSDAILTEAMIDTARTLAIEELASELNLNEDEVDMLLSVEISFSDLGGTTLGYVDDEGGIVLDDDGAGHGWTLSGDTSDGLNLLHVLKHEFGHILGLEHDHADYAWMDETIDVDDPLIVSETGQIG